MNIQINDISDITLVESESGGLCASPNDDKSIVAKGDSEQEAIDNLLEMVIAIAKLRTDALLLSQMFIKLVSERGMSGFADCWWNGLIANGYNPTFYAQELIYFLRSKVGASE